MPVNLLTFGLFTLIINAWMVMLADRIVAGFCIPGFWPALGTAVIILFCSTILKPLFLRKVG